jgi:hypothetical protein
MTAFDPNRIAIADSVPANLKDEEYLRRLRAIENSLRIPERFEKTCTHEAGHLIYFRRAGFADFVYCGPKIFHDGRQFVYWVAWVNPSAFNGNIFYSDELLRGIARGAAAGGVFLEVLLGCSVIDNGSGDDLMSFGVHCSRAQAQLSRPLNVQERWNRARSEVKLDLENNIIRPDEVERAKAEVVQNCFSDARLNQA